MTEKQYSVDWETEIKEYEDSGLTLKGFVQGKPYSYNAFYYWFCKKRNKLVFTQPQPINFLPVICNQSKDITSDTISVNGYELSFNKDTDEKILKKLLGVLKDLWSRDQVRYISLMGQRT